MGNIWLGRFLMGRTKNNVEQVMDGTMKNSGLNREEKRNMDRQFLLWVDFLALRSLSSDL